MVCVVCFGEFVGVVEDIFKGDVFVKDEDWFVFCEGGGEGVVDGLEEVYVFGGVVVGFGGEFGVGEGCGGGVVEEGGGGVIGGKVEFGVWGMGWVGFFWCV